MLFKWINKSLFFLMFFAIAGYAATDSDINSAVQSKIAADNTVSNLNIKVATTQGEVSLIGVVDTDQQASALVQLASSTTGVKDVNTSQLVVKNSNQPFTDLFITAKIKGIFIREELFGNNSVPLMTINIETKNGVVYLTGSAVNQAQINNAVKLTKTVKGVNKVDNKIKIVKY
jgi:hyperosmotically inducible protein